MEAGAGLAALEPPHNEELAEAAVDDNTKHRRLTLVKCNPKDEQAEQWSESRQSNMNCSPFAVEIQRKVATTVTERTYARHNLRAN